jgi:methyl acetate hydrolase
MTQMADVDVTLRNAAEAREVPGVVAIAASFLINTKRTAQGRSAGSLAWAGLANTYFWADPGRKVGGVILMQFLPFADAKALELFGALERGVYQALDGSQKAA